MPLGEHADHGDGPLLAGGDRIGEHRLEQLPRPPRRREERLPHLVVDEQRLDRRVAQRDELEPGRRTQLVEVDVVALAQLGARLDRLRQRRDERGLVLDRRVDALVAGRRPVDRERPLEIAEDADVVDDQPVLLLGEDAVRAGDRLHQRVVPHRAVEVDGRAARRVEPRHPHRAHEDEPQRVARILEPLVELLGEHPRPVRPDVEPDAARGPRPRSAPG